MPQSRACLICRSSRFQERYPATFDGSAAEASKHFLSFRESVKRGRIVECAQCGFVFTDPQFSPSEYDTIYQQAPAGTARQQRWLKVGNKARAERLRAFSLDHLQPGTRILDFGAGGGDFLDLMRDFDSVGFDVAPGVRPDGVKIYSGSFETLVGSGEFAAGSFDAITAWDVFEHLPNLEQTLPFLKTLLRPKGYLLLTLPNIDSAAARRAGPRWSSLLLEHLWYFSPETLQRFLSAYEFDHVDQRQMPYPVSVSHMIGRATQTYFKHALPAPGLLDKIVIPLEIGLMAAAFVRR